MSKFDLQVGFADLLIGHQQRLGVRWRMLAALFHEILPQRLQQRQRDHVTGIFS